MLLFASGLFLVGWIYFSCRRTLAEWKLRSRSFEAKWLASELHTQELQAKQCIFAGEAKDLAEARDRLEQQLRVVREQMRTALLEEETLRQSVKDQRKHITELQRSIQRLQHGAHAGGTGGAAGEPRSLSSPLQLAALAQQERSARQLAERDVAAALNRDAAYQEQIAQLQAHQVQLEEQSRRQTEQIVTLQANVAAWQSKALSAAQDMAALQHLQCSAASEAASHRQQANQAAEALQELQAQYAAVKQECDAMQQRLNVAQPAVSEASMLEQLADAQAAATALQQTAEDLAAACAHLTAQLQQEQEASREAARGVVEAESAAISAQQEVAQLTNAIQEVKEQLLLMEDRAVAAEKTLQRCEHAEEQLVVTKQRAESLQQQIRVEQSRAGEAVQIAAAAQEQAAEAEQAAQTTEQQLLDLQEKYAATQEQVATAQQLALQQQTAAAEASMQLNAVQQELDQTRKQLEEVQKQATAFQRQAQAIKRFSGVFSKAVQGVADDGKVQLSADASPDPDKQAQSLDSWRISTDSNDSAVGAAAAAPEASTPGRPNNVAAAAAVHTTSPSCSGVGEIEQAVNALGSSTMAISSAIDEALQENRQLTARGQRPVHQQDHEHLLRALRKAQLQHEQQQAAWESAMQQLQQQNELLETRCQHLVEQLELAEDSSCHSTCSTPAQHQGQSSSRAASAAATPEITPSSWLLGKGLGPAPQDRISPVPRLRLDTLPNRQAFASVNSHDKSVPVGSSNSCQEGLRQSNGSAQQRHQLEDSATTLLPDILQQQLQQMNKDCVQLQVEVTSLTADRNCLQVELGHLEQKVSTLKHALADAEAARSTAEANAEQLLQELQLQSLEKQQIVAARDALALGLHEMEAQSRFQLDSFEEDCMQKVASLEAKVANLTAKVQCIPAPCPAPTWQQSHVTGQATDKDEFSTLSVAAPELDAVTVELQPQRNGSVQVALRYSANTHTTNS